VPVTAVAADLARVAALVPVRGLERAKARLGEALDAEERQALTERLLRRTLEATTGAAGVALVAVVSPDRGALDIAATYGAATLEDGGSDLNAALRVGRDWALAAGATALLVFPVDLPAIDPGTVAAIVARARQAIEPANPSESGRPADARSLVALVPDRAGTGTNALLLSPPGAIAFAFGPGSRAAHATAAARAGARYLELGGPLRLDLDLPDDLLETGEPSRPEAGR
jgi:2-phospho-L-lactate/phosphoenolpyruvate guanylyltransferase